MYWLHFSLCCIPIVRDGKGKTSFGGPLSHKGKFNVIPFTGSLHVKMVFLFLGRVAFFALRLAFFAWLAALK